MQTYLSVVIPSYNEMTNLKRGVLDQVLAYLHKQSYTWEVILSDDGSTDGTLNKLQDFASANKGVKVLANPHRGKAPTVTAGMLQAKGRWRLYTDFDQSTPIAEIEKLWPYTQRGFSVIIGSREMVGSSRDKEPIYRHLMGRGFNLIVQALAVPGVLDTQCGFKMFSEQAAESLFKQLVVYGSQKERKDAFVAAYDVELLFLALKNDLSIREVPIKWQHHHTDRVSPIKDSLRMFRDVVLIRIADLMGRYQMK